jgi:hypothetical protein
MATAAGLRSNRKRRLIPQFQSSAPRILFSVSKNYNPEYQSPSRTQYFSTTNNSELQAPRERKKVEEKISPILASNLTLKQPNSNNHNTRNLYIQ